MQNPIESKGLLFPVEELKRFTLKEIDGKSFDAIVGVTDTADEGTDYLCSPVGKKIGEYTYITDVVFTQDPIEITEPLVAQQIIDSDCEVMKIESNSGGKSFSLNVRKLIKGKSDCDIVFEPQTANKETRILMNAGYIKKNFYFRSDYTPGSDYDTFMRWLTSYIRLGKNRHDDAPDGVTMLAEYVKVLGGKRAKKKAPEGYYTPSELTDKGYTPYEIKQIMKTMPKPWEKASEC
jgi:predicted phage terminase large subunit-like protein